MVEPVRVIDVVIDYMVYAHHADAHCESHEAQFALLDQLQYKLNKYDSMMNGRGNNQWIVELMNHQGGSNVQNLLEPSILYSLEAYVCREISTKRIESRQLTGEPPRTCLRL